MTMVMEHILGKRFCACNKINRSVISAHKKPALEHAVLTRGVNCNRFIVTGSLSLSRLDFLGKRTITNQARVEGCSGLSSKVDDH